MLFSPNISFFLKKIHLFHLFLAIQVLIMSYNWNIFCCSSWVYGYIINFSKSFLCHQYTILTYCFLASFLTVSLYITLSIKQLSFRGHLVLSYQLHLNVCMHVLYFDLRPGQKCHSKVMHRKEVTHSNGSYEKKSRGWKLADEMGRGKKNSHGTLIDWCTRREWPVNCMTVISAWWRSNAIPKIE